MRFLVKILIINKRYKIKKEIGTGGFATVFKCFDQINQNNVAIKMFNSNSDAWIEYKKMKCIERRSNFQHKNLMRMLTQFADEEYKYCIVYKLLGPDVEKAMKVKKFEIEEVRLMAYQLVSTIKFLHDRRIAHTDIKPANIMLEKNYFNKDSKDFNNPDIIVADFGSASIDEDLKHETVTTLPYRAPEVLMGAKWDYSCDVWSIGCTIFEIFTGEKLFKGIYDEEELKWFMHKSLKLPNSIISKQKRLPVSDQEMYRVKYPKVEKLSSMIHSYFNKSSKEEQDLYKLIVEMLKCDPKERITLTEVLELPFFEKYNRMKPKNLDADCLKEAEKVRIQAAMSL